MLIGTIGRNAARMFGFTVVAGFVLLALAGGPAAAAGTGPSFDCRKAASADERAICANRLLSRLDAMLSAAYAQFTPEFGDKRAIGKGLLADRHACGSDEACIAAVQVNALQTYDGDAQWAESYVDALIGAKASDLAAGMPDGMEQALPEALGACGMTHITELGTRFGDPLEGADPNAGVSVGYSNDGWGVSYDMVNELYDAKIGDPVLMCLVSVPRDCPKDDVRGRVYYSLDARTGRAWSLPDSQHSCGGA